MKKRSALLLVLGIIVIGLLIISQAGQQDTSTKVASSSSLRNFPIILAILYVIVLAMHIRQQRRSSE